MDGNNDVEVSAALWEVVH